jgi:hypothetical protein
LLAWHDRVGCAETAGIFVGLVLAAWALSWRSARKTAEPGLPRAAGETAINPAARAGNEGWAVLLSFACLPFITSAWFALSPGGPIRAQQAPLWTVTASVLSPDWRAEPISLSPLDLSALDFTEGQTVALSGPMDKSAVIYHFFWKTDASTGYGHTPDHCMLAAGWKLEGSPEAIRLRIGKTDFPGKLYRFERDGDEEVVLQSVWYGGDPMLSAGEFPYSKGGPRTSRLAMLWEEPRRRGLESLSIYMPPAAGREEQTRAAEEVLAQVVVPNLR